MVNHQLVNFGGHRHGGTGDMMILVRHVILQDHVIQKSCEFMGRIPLRYVTMLPRLVAIGTVVVEIQLF